MLLVGPLVQTRVSLLTNLPSDPHFPEAVGDALGHPAIYLQRLGYVLRVEKIFGRKRLFKDGPRTLDIDILFYENVVMETEKLTLPHPGWKERESVLIPLQYISKKDIFSPKGEALVRCTPRVFPAGN